MAQLIRIENRPFFYTSWLKKGVKEVRDLLNQDQTFLSYNAFVAKFNIKTNYLEYFKVIAALKQFKKVCPPTLVNPSTNDTASLLSHPNINKESYRRLVQDKASKPLQSQEKWLAEKDIVGNSTVIGELLTICHSIVQEKQSLEYSSLNFYIDE